MAWDVLSQDVLSYIPQTLMLDYTTFLICKQDDVDDDEDDVIDGVMEYDVYDASDDVDDDDYDEAVKGS